MVLLGYLPPNAKKSTIHHLDAIQMTLFGNLLETQLGTKKTGKGRRKVGRKKRRMRAKIRHRKK